MRRFGRSLGLWLGVIAVVAVIVWLQQSESAGQRCAVAERYQSQVTDINLEHVFCGEINRHGRAVGFHVRPDSAADVASSTTIDRILTPPNHHDIYTARVTIQGVEKEGFSSFFPDHCNDEQIIASIRHAARNCRVCGQRFRGHSAPLSGATLDPTSPATAGENTQTSTQTFCTSEDGEPFIIEGWYLGERGQSIINTAYPRRERR